MKTQFLLFFIFISLGIVGQSDGGLEKEDWNHHLVDSHQFHIGLGFPNKAGTALSGLELLGIVEDGKASPQFTIKYEYALNEQIGIGAQFGYYQAQSPKVLFETSELVGILCDLFPDACSLVEATVDGRLKIQSYSIAARTSYHFVQLTKLDSYVSASFGYNFIKQKTIGTTNDQFTNVNQPSFVYYTSAGVRYFFSRQVALYGEVGYGNIALINAGLSFRF